eukprot:10593078-Alexandrium_andersonii.AAC.1
MWRAPWACWPCAVALCCATPCESSRTHAQYQHPDFHALCLGSCLVVPAPCAVCPVPCAACHAPHTLCTVP